MKRAAQLLEWIKGAAAEFGDASVPVCQMFLRWEQDLDAYEGEDLACGLIDGQLAIDLGPQLGQHPIEIETTGARVDDQGRLAAFGVEPIAPSVWSLTPSLNMPPVVHGFIVLYGVPDPAPWERRIILPGGG